MAFGTNDIDPAAPKDALDTLREDAHKSTQGFGVNDIDPMEPAKPAPEDNRSIVQKTLDAFTGNDRREFDLPELGTSGPDVPAFSKEGMKMFGAYALSPDPNAIADIAVKTLDGATQKKDKFGNAIVSWRGKDYYVNAPGLSEADMFKLTADIAQFASSAKSAMFFKNIFGRALAVGATAGATSIAQDVGAMALGSEQGVDPTRAGFAAGAGAGFEFASPVVAAIWQKAKSGIVSLVSQGKRLMTPEGTLTPNGASILRDAGIDPNNVTPEMLRNLDEAASRVTGQFGQDAKRATAGAGGARAARAQEFGFDLTKGQSEQNMRQIGREEAMRNYARGARAGDRMQVFDQAQTEGIQQGAKAKQAALGGRETPAVEDVPTAAGTLAERTQNAAQAQARAVDAAYKAAGEKTATLTGESLKGMRSDIIRSLRNPEAGVVVSEKLTPATVDALGRLKKLVTIQGGRIKSMDLKRIETYRRELNSLIDAAANPTDKRNVVLIKKSLDDWLENAVDRGLFQGDQETLALLKQARNERSTYGRLFEGRDASKDVQNVLNKITDGEVTNVEMANWLYGNARLGQTGRNVRLVRQFKDIHGTDSAEWGLLREGAFVRALYGNKTAQQIGRQQIKSNLDEALGPNSREYLKELFSPDEIKMLERFRDAIGDTITPRKVSNPSGTGYEIARAVGDMWDKMIRAFTVTNGLAGNYGMAAATAALGGVKSGARQATKVPRWTLPPYRAALFTAAGPAAISPAGTSNE